ncbi:MAG: hypothetical protein ACYTG0_40360 [Planctomycetota bacterium]|jgi:hypothetical protein
MVKLNGPMFSIDASGKLADAIVFSKWKGRNYARSLVTPANPQSGGQTGMRRMLRFLSQQWANQSAADQATWETPADAAVVSPFNSFVGANLQRWRNFLPPGQTYPVPDTGTVGTLLNEAATAGVRQITIDIDVSVLNNNWGILIFRDLSAAFSTAWTNMVQAILADSVASFSWIDTPLAAGTYYYNFRAFSEDGVLGAEHGEVNATVT